VSPLPLPSQHSGVLLIDIHEAISVAMQEFK